MAGRRADVYRLQEVVRLHRMGRSRRQIAQELRMGRDTIAKAVAAFGAGGLLEGDPHELPELASLQHAIETAHPPKPVPQQTSSVEAWREVIARLRLAKVAQPTAIHDWLRVNKEGYTGSLSAV